MPARELTMAKFIFGMNMSLDGYVDHDHPSFAPPGPVLFRHFIERTRTQAGSLYGRVLYETMRVWDDDMGWNDAEREYAAAWRASPKWVVSRSLGSVGPNATLIDGDLETALRDLRSRVDGEIEVGGPKLAASVAALGLLDEYHIYLHPLVLGAGTRFFAEPVPRLRLVGTEQVDDDVIRLAYAPG